MGHAAMRIELDLAALDQDTGEPLASTLHPRAGTGGRQTEASGQLALRYPFQVDETKDDLVILGKLVPDPGHTRRKRRQRIRIRLRGGEIGRKRFGMSLTPPKVDQRMASDSEEPGARILKLAECLALDQDALENALEDLVHLTSIGQALGQKASQLIEVLVPGSGNAVHGSSSHKTWPEGADGFTFRPSFAARRRS
jgi:hypothetical protein